MANRAHALALLGRTAEAEHAYREALPLAASNQRVEVTALAGYARLLTDLGNLDAARELLTKAHAKAPPSLLDTTMDLVLEAWVQLETKAGRAEEVSRWSDRRLRRIEEQYRVRLANVLRQAQLLESIERERTLDRQRAEAALQASRTQVREALLQDLHDGFGSNLATARIRAARGELTQAALVEILDECISDLYLVVDSIPNTEGNLGEALRMLRNRLEGRLYGEHTSLRWQIALDALPAVGHERMNQVLRIVQEALANVFKHAQAAHAWVDAAIGDDGTLTVTVGDDGVGTPDEPAAGNGLNSMRGRARSLGARLHIQPGNPGTVVRLSVPA
jgi:signal transduction histidine kinase